MKNLIIPTMGLCVCVILMAGCMSQTQEVQQGGANDPQGAASPQGPSGGPQNPGRQGQDARRGAPQEAIDACGGKSANDSCSFTFNGNPVNGYCRGRPNGVLTCFSSNMGPGGMFRNGSQQGQRFGRGLPQEAVDVCEGKSVNDTCEFKMNETVVQGACRAGRTGNMTCIPSNMGQRPIPGGGS